MLHYAETHIVCDDRHEGDNTNSKNTAAHIRVLTREVHANTRRSNLTSWPLPQTVKQIQTVASQMRSCVAFAAGKRVRGRLD